MAPYPLNSHWVCLPVVYTPAAEDDIIKTHNRGRDKQPLADTLSGQMTEQRSVLHQIMKGLMCEDGGHVD